MKKHNVLRRCIVPVAALAAVALLSWGVGAARQASAHEPHPGLEFHIGVDTNGDSVDDCSTVGDAPGFCALPIGTMFTVNAYLDSIDGLVNYDGFEVWEDYNGVVSKGVVPTDERWPDCGFPYINAQPGYTIVACAAGLGQHSTYTGKIATATYTCAADGTITLHHGVAFSNLADSNGIDFHAEAGPDVLNIRCFAPSLGGVAGYPELSSGSNAGLAIGVAAGVAAALIVALSGLAWRRRTADR